MSTTVVQIFILIACLVVHSYGFYPSGSAMGRSAYGRNPFNPFGGGAMGRLRIGGPPVTTGLTCDENIPYQDECQRRCVCRNNQLVCPEQNPCSLQNKCPSYGDGGGSYTQECNTCFCLAIGLICTANQC